MSQRNPKKRRALITSLAWLACLVAVSPTVFAQDPPPGSGSSNPPMQATYEISIEDRLSQKISAFEFGGGTVEEYVDALRQTTGKPSLNVVIAENARRQRMPEVTLGNVTIKAMFNLVQELCVDSNDNSLVNVELGSEFDREYIFIRSSGSGPQRIVRVFSIAGLKTPKNQVSEENLLKAVDSVMAMNESKDVQIQIHAEANLLIAKGTMEELDLIQQTITQMTGGLNALGGWGGNGASGSPGHEGGLQGGGLQGGGLQGGGLQGGGLQGGGLQGGGLQGGGGFGGGGGELGAVGDSK